MTSATARPPTGESGYQEARHGRGFMAFASILLLVIGCFNVIYGVAAIGNSNVFVADAGGRAVAVRETDKLRGAFASPAEVATGLEHLETWSRIVFEALETSTAGRSSQ